MKKIGLIGLGAMGYHMANRLISSNNPLNIYNRTKSSLKPFINSKAKIYSESLDLIKESDIVITMVSDGNAIDDIFDSGKIFHNFDISNKIFLDMSTISPKTTIDMSEKANSSGNFWLDCPVLGSTPAAESGNLVFIIGGSREIYEDCRYVFDILGNKSMHMGPSGSGQAAKLVHNSICGVVLSSLAEGYKLGIESGLDKERLLDLFQSSAFISPVVEAKIDLIRNDDYSPMFQLKLMQKDLSLSLDAFEELGLKSSVIHSAREMYTNASKSGYGNFDSSAVIKYLEERKK